MKTAIFTFFALIWITSSAVAQTHEDILIEKYSLRPRHKLGLEFGTGQVTEYKILTPIPKHKVYSSVGYTFTTKAIKFSISGQYFDFRLKTDPQGVSTWDGYETDTLLRKYVLKQMLFVPISVGFIFPIKKKLDLYITPGICIGALQTFIEHTEYFTKTNDEVVYETKGDDKKKRYLLTGVTLGAGLEYHFNKTLSIDFNIKRYVNTPISRFGDSGYPINYFLTSLGCKLSISNKSSYLKR